MDKFTNLLTAFGNIQINTETVIFAFIIVVGVILYKIIDDYKFGKYYNDMKNEKNKEIERLADDNRRYRDIYLKSIGINQEQIDAMSATKVKGK